jgi:hypothetical protein
MTPEASKKSEAVQSSAADSYHQELKRFHSGSRLRISSVSHVLPRRTRGADSLTVPSPFHPTPGKVPPQEIHEGRRTMARAAFDGLGLRGHYSRSLRRLRRSRVHTVRFLHRTTLYDRITSLRCMQYKPYPSFTYTYPHNVNAASLRGQLSPLDSTRQLSLLIIYLVDPVKL